MKYFQLAKDGDSAIVRFLHSSVAKIEKATVHKFTQDGKTKYIKCSGDSCAMCAKHKTTNADWPLDRCYIHLINYNDKEYPEQLWSRTSKILPDLKKLEEDWGNLSESVFKITRIGSDNRATYEIKYIKQSDYPAITEEQKKLVDVELAKFQYLNRKPEEVQQLATTGSLPERKPWVPKDEYKKTAPKTATPVASKPAVTETDDSLPF